MTGEQPAQAPELPPEDFAAQTKGALEHLYDLMYLQQHPLAQEGWLSMGSPAEVAGQRLRREMVAAIETLNPGKGVPVRAPHSRLYNLLVMHYMEGRTVREAAHDLGISPRQALRNLRQAEQNVAAVLWARRSAAIAQGPVVAQTSSIRAEMAQLERRPQPTDMCHLLQRAQGTVGQLAAQRDISFQVELPEGRMVLPTEPVVAEQVLVSVLSHAIQQAQPGTFHLALATKEGRQTLTLRYAPRPEEANAPIADRVAMQLVGRLGWMVKQEDQPEGLRTIVLHMAARSPVVLVIDDNEGLVKLVKRYLADHACRVIAAVDGQEGLRLAQETVPDAVVLDVMMPRMPGWEVLQRLRQDPQTAHIPVIICSVIKDPELAHSLGAALFLPKPIGQQDILNALLQLGVM